MSGFVVPPTEVFAFLKIQARAPYGSFKWNTMNSWWFFSTHRVLAVRR
jgi:hypothetical protein